MGNKSSTSNEKESLQGAALTYTQVLEHVNPGVEFDGNKHGANRDSVKIKIFSKNQAVISAADGAGLLYWSEVASRIASKKFVEYFEKFVKENPAPSVETVLHHMKEAILYTNQELINYHHDKTKERVLIMDLGGQTTLGGFFIFRLNEKDQRVHKKKWGAACVGTGDSPSFKLSNGTWTEMFRDDGQMLPFYGLTAYNIKDPSFQTAEVGDIFFATSDGVCDSFSNRNPPELSIEPTASLNEIVGLFVNKVEESHLLNKTDPDDVTVGAIQIREEQIEQQYPLDIPVEDKTTHFYPEFSLKVDLPWCSYSYPTKKQ